jgi:hypothetical protein
MTAETVSAALKAYREAIAAAERELARTRAQSRATAAAVMLAAARLQRALDEEVPRAARLMPASVRTCLHDRIEDAPDGIVGCCARVPAMAGAR